ncbi:MAG: hypothetical protein B7Y48_07665 [Methylophilales bacterium 28-44-11]|nr:MAG: hypothetical protein B7Y48_07665 [Methylophilales bacterium 28-44-11]
MATEKKAKAVRYTSPKGVFVYPYLVKPDFGQGQFANTTGIYKVNLRLTEEEAAPMLAKLQPLFDAAVQEGEQKFAGLKVEARKKLKSLTVTELFDVEYDKETEEPTGTIVFKFSTKASGKNAKGEAWNRSMPLFSASGKAIKPTMVGGGTIGKVSFEASPYFVPATGVAGLKLYLVGAQILELSEGGSGGSADSYGFGAEEGYDDPSEAEESSDFSDESGDSTPDDEDNF